MIQVIIVDDDIQRRYTMRAILERSGECIVVGEFNTPTEVIALAHIHHPAIVLLNGDLNPCDAFEIVWLLRSSVATTVGIIILTQVPDEEQLFQFMKVGANAYKMRTISPEVLLETVRRVSSGEFLFSEE